MEQERDTTAQEQQVYTPRPTWQVWMARIGLVLFIAVVIYYYIAIARGGM